MAFDQVISLGHRCYTAVQFRRMLIHTVSMPFDSIIADADKAADAIRQKFEGSLREENLSSHPLYVLDRKYDFQHWHDFKDVANPALDFANVVSKRKFVVDRFFKLLQSPARVLFVRHETPGAGSESDIANLIDAITRCRPPQSFFMLYLSDQIEDRQTDRFLALNCPKMAEIPDSIWDSVMDRMNRIERIKGYRPGLVRRYQAWPKPIRTQTFKLIGTARKRKTQLWLAAN